MREIILIITLCMLTMSAYAQNIRVTDITWATSHTFNIATGEMIEDTGTIISRGSSALEWRKADGTNTIFNVSEVIGQWIDTANAGEIVYEVNHEGTHGTVTFIKAGGKTSIRLMLMTGGTPLTYELIVSDYQPQ